MDSYSLVPNLVGDVDLLAELLFPGAAPATLNILENL